MNYEKTYGIIKSNGRYNVCSEISGDKSHYHEHPSLSYKKADFALQKAENFIRACHKDHVRNFGSDGKVTFTFRNMGII